MVSDISAVSFLVQLIAVVSTYLLFRATAEKRLRATAATERIRSAAELRERVERRRQPLAAALEPNFGIAEELLSCGALSADEREDVRAERTRVRRSRLLLDCVLAKAGGAACVGLLVALENTDQRHLVNFLLQDSGAFCRRAEVPTSTPRPLQTAPTS